MSGERHTHNSDALPKVVVMIVDLGDVRNFRLGVEDGEEAVVHGVPGARLAKCGARRLVLGANPGKVVVVRRLGIKLQPK